MDTDMEMGKDAGTDKNTNSDTDANMDTDTHGCGFICRHRH